MDLDALFAEHRDGLFRYLARYTGDLDLAEDLVQETFLKAVVHPPATGDNVKGWLFTVATNLAKDVRKTARRHEELLRSGGVSSVGNPPADPSAEAERADAWRRVRTGLDALNHKERTALLLRAEGFAHREIASALDTTTGSIGTLVARALAKLGAALGLSRGVHLEL